jgi:hypothetical protein
MGRRTRADRDAITVETGYALVSGLLRAAAAFAVVAGAGALPGLPEGAERGLLRAGCAAAALAFGVRVRAVLWRFPRGPAPGGGEPDQPSQPGRTSPDS